MSLPAEAPTYAKGNPKKVWLAVLLNLFPLVMGMGYLYLYDVRWFIVVFGIQVLSLIPMTMLGLGEYNMYFLGILWLFSLIHVAERAKKYNSTRGGSQ